MSNKGVQPTVVTALGEEVPMKRYPDRLRVETREEFEARLKRETAKELHRRPVAA